MANNIKGINSFAYQGVNAVNPPNMRILKRAPGNNDTKNVDIGDFWLDSTTEILYQLVNLSNDIATWNEVATPAGVGTSFFDTDAGTAQDLNQRLFLLGGANINTTGAGNTVTVVLNNDINISGGLTAVTDISTSTGDFIAGNGNFIATRNTGASGNVALFSDSNDTVPNQIGLSKSRLGNAIVSGDKDGTITFSGFDGANYIENVRIESSVPGTSTVAANRVAGTLAFYTHPDSTVAIGTPRMTIEPTGRVNIGSADAGTNESLFVGRTFSSTNAITAAAQGNNADGVTIRTTKQRAGAPVQPNDFLGFLSFEGFDGTSNQSSSYISGNVANGSTVAAGRVAGNMSFWTAPDAVSVPLQRMTVFDNGSVVMAFPDAPLDTTLQVQGIRELQGINGAFSGSGWFEGQTSQQTIGAVATEILQLPVADSQMILVKAQVSGFQDDFSDSIVADVFFGVYRPSGGNVTLIVTPTPPAPNIFTTSTATVDNIVDVGTQEARITVAGVALETYNWVCKYSYMYLVDDN